MIDNIVYVQDVEKKYFTIKIIPENTDKKSRADPKEAILKRVLSVVSRGAKSAFKDEILFCFKRLSCTNANNAIIAPVQSNP